MLFVPFLLLGPARESSLAEKKFTPPLDATPPVFARPPTTPKHHDETMRQTATHRWTDSRAANCLSDYCRSLARGAQRQRIVFIFKFLRATNVALTLAQAIHDLLLLSHGGYPLAK